MTGSSGRARLGGSSARVCDSVLEYWPTSALLRLIDQLCCLLSLYVRPLQSVAFHFHQQAFLRAQVVKQSWSYARV